MLGIPVLKDENGHLHLDPKLYNVYAKKLDDNLKNDKLARFLVTLVGLTEKPVRGNIMLIKQAFMFLNEEPVLIKGKPDVLFFAHSYGPYSLEINEKIKTLEMDGIIEKTAKGLQLTHKGKKLFREISEDYSQYQKDELVKYRKKLDQKGTRGILKIVYSKYPEYTKRSKVKKKVLGSENLENSNETH